MARLLCVLLVNSSSHLHTTETEEGPGYERHPLHIQFTKKEKEEMKRNK